MDIDERVDLLFLVRLWHEPSQRIPAWRGYVEHVASKQRMYFSDLSDLNDFLCLRLGNAEGNEDV